MQHAARLVLAICLVVLITSVAQAGVGIYKWSADAYLPANISYTLNADTASVTVSIVPHGTTSPVVWSVTKTAPADETKRGKHVIVWDGTGGTSGVQYDAIITAVGNAQTAGQLSPLWETTADTATRTYYQVAINNRVPTVDKPNPYFGRVYACNYKSGYKKIEMYDPDGTYIGKMNDTGINWGGSAPWGIAIDADDHVWVTDRSNRRLYRFEPDGSSYLPNPAPGWDFWTDTAITGAVSQFSRGLAAAGSGDTLKLADTHWNAGTQFGITVASGENASGLANPSSRLWKWVANPDYFTKPYQPYFQANGKLILPGYQGMNTTPANGGIFSINWDGTGVAFNSAITRPTCATTLSDGSILVGRWVQGTGDPDATIAFYQFPAGTDLSAADAASAAKLTFAATAVSGGANFPRFMNADAFGNVAVAGSIQGEAGYSYTFGLYSMPDTGVTVTQNAGTVLCSYQPRVINVTPNPVVVNADGATNTAVDVTVEDLAGYSDIASVKIVANYGAGGTTTFNGTFVSGNGNQAIYRCQLTAQVGDVAGPHAATVYAYSQAGAIPPSTASLNTRVTDGVLTGKVYATVLPSYYIAGATVTADAGDGDVQTTVSAADGSFSLDMTGGKSYAIAVSKNGWSTTNGTHITVPHLETVNHDAKLAPLDVRDTIVVGTDRRPDAQFVACAAVVMRQSAQTGRNGIQDYYVLSDNKWNNTQQGCLVYQRTSDPYFNEGDLVLVEGTWTINSGDKDGYILPTSTPKLISTGNTYPDPVQFYWNNAPQDYVKMDGDKTWGRYVYINGAQVVPSAVVNNQALDPLTWDGVSYRFSEFIINVPASETDPTLKSIKVEIDTKTTVGCYYPKVGDVVDVKGVVCWTDTPWGFWSETTSNVIKPGKPTDVVMHPFPDPAAFRNMNDGQTVLFQNDADPMVVTLIDAANMAFSYAENSDRTFGIRMVGNNSFTPLAGDSFTRLVGTLGTDSVTGERTFKVTDYTSGPSGQKVAPLGVTSRSIGGAKLGQCNGITGGIGLQNVGLRVKLAGTVMKSDGIGFDGFYADWYLYDGYGAANDLGDPSMGVKVRSIFNYPNVGDHVSATGVVTLEKSGDSVIPVIYVNGETYNDDVTTY